MSEVTLPSFNPPEPLGKQHCLEEFCCGEAALDNWFKKHALKNHESGASRTFVVTSGDRTSAFMSLAVGQISHAGATGSMRRNMPNPVPVMILARLAVDRDFQGYSLGKGLVREAVLRSLQASEHGGIRGLVVHALNERVSDFYENLGFQRSRLDDLTLMASLKTLHDKLV